MAINVSKSIFTKPNDHVPCFCITVEEYYSDVQINVKYFIP